MFYQVGGQPLIAGRRIFTQIFLVFRLSGSNERINVINGAHGGHWRQIMETERNCGQDKGPKSINMHIHAYFLNNRVAKSWVSY